jgi:hypothetical protein
MIVNALAGKPLPVYGDGMQIRDWLYVKDHCSAIRRVLEAGGWAKPTTSAAGTKSPTSTSCTPSARCSTNCAQGRRQPYKDQITYVTDRPWPRPPLRHRCPQARTRTGLETAETFETGIRKTVQWYLDNPEWVANVQSGAYREWVGKQYGSTMSNQMTMPQRHHPRRWLRHTAAPGHAGHQQAAAAGVRQADDLLPAQHPHAGGHPRRAHHQHPARHPALPATAGRWQPVGHEPQLRRAAQPGWPGASLHHWRASSLATAPARWCWATTSSTATTCTPLLADARPQQTQRCHRVRLPRHRPRALRCGGFRQNRQSHQHRRKARPAPRATLPSRACTFTTTRWSTSPKQSSPVRGASSKSPRQPGLPGKPATHRANHAAWLCLAGHRYARQLAGGWAVHCHAGKAPRSEDRVPGRNCLAGRLDHADVQVCKLASQPLAKNGYGRYLQRIIEETVF